MRQPKVPPLGLTAPAQGGDNRLVRDVDEAREIESLIDRLSAEYPGVPADSVHEVARAAWAQVANNPVRLT